MSEPGKAVFLSYASQDAEAAKRIADALRAAGVEMWFDQSELVGGDAWDAKIRKQIRECALLIPVISKTTQARREAYFRLEWKLADERTHLMAKGTPFLLPVTIDETSDRDALVPDAFLAVQWTKAPNGEVPLAFVARVKKLLEGEMEAGRPRPAERGGGTPPSSIERTPRLGPWLALGAVMVVGLALAVSRPWQRSDAPGLKPSPAAPLSEARQLAEKAKDLIKPGATRTELEAADKLCAKAASLDPADAEVLAVWSQVCSWFAFHHFDPDLERRDAAKTRADQAIELDAKSFEARFAQAFYLTPLIGGRLGSADDEKTADKIQQQLLQERPDEPRVLLALGIRQGRSAHVEDARATLGRLTKNPAYAAAAWGELGWAELLAANYAAAETAVDRANEIQPLWRNLVLKSLLAVDWHGDVDLALAMEKRMPAGVAVLGVLGAYHHLVDRDPKGTLQNIEGMSRNWLRTGGYEGPTAVWAALAYEQLHEKDRAEAAWQFALKLIEENLTAEPASGLYQLKAFVLASLDRPVEAEKALRLAPDAAKYVPGPWLARNRYLLTQVRLGHADIAMEYLENDPRLTAAVLRTEPDLDRLRALPRFQALLAKLEADPSRSPTAKALVPAATQKADDKSVAVLPFANLSDDKDSGYFADGVHEDILTDLSKVRSLRVISRTSVMQYRTTTKTVPQIAQELGVGYILEGSVRRTGNKVRVTGQLIRAGTEGHVWAKTYDRDLTDIFAIQSELAEAIAGALHAVLSPEETAGLEARPTKSIEAYDCFQKARVLDRSLADVHDVSDKIVPLLERAVVLDPDYAAAWAELTRQYLTLRGSEERALDRLSQAKEALAHAERLAPDAYVVLVAGMTFGDATGDRAMSNDRHRRIIELFSQRPESLLLVASDAMNQAKWGEAQANFQAALRLDQLNPEALEAYFVMLDSMRRWDEAEVVARTLAEVQPDNLEARLLAASMVFRRNGSTAQLTRLLAELPRGPEASSSNIVVRSRIAFLTGDWSGIVALWREAGPRFRSGGFDDSSWRFMVAGAFLRLGDAASARPLLERNCVEFERQLAADPGSSGLLTELGLARAMLGDRDGARTLLDRAGQLIVMRGYKPPRAFGARWEYALVRSWVDDKKTVIAEIGRLLREPSRRAPLANVHVLRVSWACLPLDGDPEFEAMLNDPGNNAPLF